MANIAMKPVIIKPEKPDEDKYRIDIAEAEKVYERSRDAYVCENKNAQL
jgi:hypothetical protein